MQVAVAVLTTMAVQQVALVVEEQEQHKAQTLVMEHLTLAVVVVELMQMLPLHLTVVMVVQVL
jgi:hypothetical protein